MWTKLKAMWPGQPLRRRLLYVGLIGGVAVAAFCWGRHGATTPAAAQQQPGARQFQFDPTGKTDKSDYKRRVVAFVHGNVPITREELGEYLIARFGAERVEFLVNRRIIEMACQARGIHVTDTEVDVQLERDLKMLGVSEKDFVNKLLKPNHKSLFEYREDVIRPKLAMQKMCRDLVTVTEEDIQKSFEARYSERIRCRMILLPKEMGRKASDVWARVKQSDAAFDEEAMKQPFPELAAKKGEIPPIHHHFPDKRVEAAAFALQKVGDISELISVPEDAGGGFMILKLVERIQPDLLRKLHEERPALHQEVFEAKLAAVIPQTFQQLRAAARPQLILRREPTPEEQDRRIREQLQGLPIPPGTLPAAPSGK